MTDLFGTVDSAILLKLISRQPSFMKRSDQVNSNANRFTFLASRIDAASTFMQRRAIAIESTLSSPRI